MKSFLPLLAPVLLTASLFFPGTGAFAQLPDGVLLREIAPCQVLLGGFTSPPEAEHEQPCQQPAINELLIRKFSDQTYGVSLNYTDYSRSWARLLECGFTGMGVQKGSAIVVSPIEEESAKASPGKVCQVLVKATAPLDTRNSAYTLEIGPDCSTVCSHPEDINSVSIESRKGKPFSPSFDCRKASTLVEKSICLDWNLSELDFKVAELWYEKYGAGEDIPGEARSTHAKWLLSRNQCRSNVSCIREKYQQRVKALCNALSRKVDKRGSCQI